MAELLCWSDLDCTGVMKWSVSDCISPPYPEHLLFNMLQQFASEQLYNIPVLRLYSNSRYD